MGNMIVSNFANELHFNIDDIVYCEYVTYNLLKDKKYTKLYAYETKILISRMNKCNYVYECMYNGKNRLLLTLKSGDKVEIAFTDCGKYVGKPCSANKPNKWYYIRNSMNNKTNPFIYLLE